jgi:hypothetical protein
MAKYLKIASGGFAEEATVVGATTSAANQGLVPELNALGTLNPALVGAAATGAGKIPILDGNGRLDSTTMPAGFGVDQNIVTASETLSAGDFVNVWSGGVRKADAATNKPAHGFVLSAVANAASATVVAEGTNTAITGLTLGPVWLSASTPGAATNNPPTGTGKIVQAIGVAVSTTAVNFQQGPSTLLA